jgi:filamentous hemagglutinin family protein
MKRLALVSLLALATAEVASAQTVATDIRADTDANRSLGTTVTTSGRVRTIDGGRLSGPNLFHSFSNFNLAAGDTARWQHSAANAASIENIVNRVTGGNPSDIFGRIDTTAIPSADFFFINPAGIVFGAGAIVAVPNAAHFSTARELKFADGQTFSLTTPSGSTFSMASPTSFGFVGSRGDIRVAVRSSNQFATGVGLHLSAGNISVANSQFRAGSFHLTAVGSANTAVPLETTAPPVGDGRITMTSGNRIETVPTARQQGGISLTAAIIDLTSTVFRVEANAEASGSVSIRGDTVGLTASQALTFAGDAGEGGPLLVEAGSLTLDRVALQARTGTAFKAGDVTIRALGAAKLIGSTGIDSDTNAGSTGDAGSVIIEAESLLADGLGRISSTTRGAGNGGSVNITAGRIELTNGVRVVSEAATGATGDGGSIRISTDELLITRTGAISTSTFGPGQGGQIDVAAGRIEIAGTNTGIVTNTRSEGRGGGINIRAGQVAVLDNGRIASNVFSSGDAGSIDLKAKDLLLDTGAAIAAIADFNTSGDAGTIRVDSGTITLLNGSQITTNTGAAGDAGALDITADTMVVKGVATLVTSATKGTGSAGEVSISAGRLLVAEQASVSTESAPGAGGPAGNVRIQAGEVTVASKGLITSSTQTDFNAGGVRVSADSLNLASGGMISTGTAGKGEAGSIELMAGLLRSDGGYHRFRSRFGLKRRRWGNRDRQWRCAPRERR